MIVRTYTAELTGPAVESGGVTAKAVRRLRAWTAAVETPWGTLAFRRGAAVPAAVEVRSAGGSTDRIAIRNPEAPMLALLKAATTLGSVRSRRKRP